MMPTAFGLVSLTLFYCVKVNKQIPLIINCQLIKTSSESLK